MIAGSFYVVPILKFCCVLSQQVERLRKHFIKSCTKSPFQKDSKEYEELLECVNSPPIEQKKKAFAGNINWHVYSGMPFTYLIVNIYLRQG